MNQATTIIGVLACWCGPAVVLFLIGLFIGDARARVRPLTKKPEGIERVYAIKE